ncbi:MAG: hypothetical protein LDL41_05285 [Coleofasciculus sp. S288]|nr:hypothetical protein [Coleofasciculus sp. S288]
MEPKDYTAYTQSSVSKPTVKLKRFWCNNISFLAYQLRNGQIVLSENQMVPQANSDIKKFVKTFIRENKLKTLSAMLPNRSISTVYPLQTVTAVWSNLNSTEQLPLREKKLLASFLSEQPIEDKKTLSGKQACCINSKAEVTDADPRFAATVVKIKLTKTTQINILVFFNSYYIEIYEGFQQLGTEPTWLEELHDSERRKKTLRQKGFSGEIKTIDYQDNDKIWRVQALSILDWISIWTYFAAKGNTKAIELLQSLAILNIDRRVKTTFCPKVVATAA